MSKNSVLFLCAVMFTQIIPVSAMTECHEREEAVVTSETTQTLLARGLEYLRAADYERAFPVLNDAFLLTENPNIKASAAVHLVEIYRNKGQFKKSDFYKSYLEKVAEDNNSAAQQSAWLYLSAIHTNQEHYKEAMWYNQRLLDKNNPKFKLAAYLSLARIYKLKREFAQAQYYLDLILNQDDLPDIKNAAQQELDQINEQLKVEAPIEEREPTPFERLLKRSRTTIHK